jgi:lysophospholipid acyltransferase (LPLAT)-like uncharacterized protein
MRLAHYGRHNPHNGLTALISASRDGALLAGVLGDLACSPCAVKQRRAQALLELTSWLERGYNSPSHRTVRAAHVNRNQSGGAWPGGARG